VNATTTASLRPPVAHAMRAFLAPTETFVHNQMATLRRYRPVVVAHRRRPETEVPLEDGVIATERLRAPLRRLEGRTRPAGDLLLPLALDVLARHVRERGCRLLHFHYLTDARMLIGLQRRTALPALASAYGYDVSMFPRAFGGLGGRYLRRAFDRLDCVLAMSEDMREDIIALGCPATKVSVHYYGSDTVRFRVPERIHAGTAGLTILCAGRLERYKGQELVLEALRRLGPVVVERDLRLVFVGDGSSRPRLEGTVERFGLSDRVTFAGHLPHERAALVEHYRDADLFVHPSFTLDGLKEGIPGTIVEAMAAGLPVVATQHAGIPAIIQSGRDGLLVPERDVSALAGALEALLESPQLRERLGRAAARRAAGELDLGARTMELERIYDRLT
jgi:colanic acid/amylovoran biosynthesis glycosyltransferase